MQWAPPGASAYYMTLTLEVTISCSLSAICASPIRDVLVLRIGQHISPIARHTPGHTGHAALLKDQFLVESTRKPAVTWAINLARLQNCLITFSRQLLHLNCECIGKAGNFTVPNLAWYNKHKSLPAQVAFNLPLLQPCCHERCSPQTPIIGPARHLALIVIKRR